MKRCIVCNRRVWPWFRFRHTVSLALGTPRKYSVCSFECYSIVLDAYQTGLSFIYIGDE